MSANDNAPELTELELQVLRRIYGYGTPVDCADVDAVRAALVRLARFGLIEISEPPKR